MGKKFKNPETLEQILDIMHKEVVGALINSQLTKDNSIPNAVDLVRPSLNDFSKEDILNAFIIFALNVAADSLSTKTTQETGKVAVEDVIMAKGGQA